ncbi:uncharacterized protein [Ptychodera flava]|uniref:uncharacterized protein n=1 Tax=Ptychodera flava TaxID=63121 RepID=UPI00396A1F4C
MAESLLLQLLYLGLSFSLAQGNTSASECYHAVDAYDYRGTVSVTVDGDTCQEWTEQSPHWHTRTPGNYPNAGLGEHNFCRNPDGENSAWCYSTDFSVRWQFCDIGQPGENCDLYITTTSSTGIYPTQTLSTAEISTTKQSPTTSKSCKKRIGNHIISIASKSSLITVGRDGLWSNASNHVVTCNDGIWSAGFPHYSNVNECDADKNICSPRTSNQECLDEIGNYRCVCQKGFVFLENNLCVPLFLFGKQCDVNALQTSKRCPAERDPVTNTYWESTAANCSSDWVNCTNGHIGKMLRFCDARGEWWDPYTTECISEDIMNMTEQVTDFSIASNTARLLTDINLSIDTAYAGDVLLAGYLIYDIIHSDPLSQPGHDADKMVYLQSIVNLVSRLLDADTEASWSQIHETRGVHLGAIALFDKLDRFGETVQRYVGLLNTDIRINSKNIGFEANQVHFPTHDIEFPSKVNSARKKRSHESVWYEIDERGSTVLVPKKNTVLQNVDRCTVIVFAYKNPANILPPGVKQGTSRQWVRTITATKKVERVNSPVISVNIYNSDERKHGKKLQEPLTFMLYHKEAGYNAKCISMIYGNPEAIWNYINCVKVGNNAASDFTECRCDRVGSVAVITTMGEMPT